MSEHQDKIYTDPLAEVAAFRFDEDVVRVFPDMIKRSVPGYATIIGMTGLLAGRYARANSHCYDLGCSLGASTLAMRQNIQAEQCTLVAIDNSAAMLQQCSQVIATDCNATEVSLQQQDILDTVIENASVVVLNFTLQFIPVAQRSQLITHIYDGLLPGGILILSEKVSFSDPALDALNIDLHHQFKKTNGYSDLEIAQKRTALENVLVPETLEQHRQRLQGSGFASCDVWFQCFNFASLIALK